MNNNLADKCPDDFRCQLCDVHILVGKLNEFTDIIALRIVVCNVGINVNADRIIFNDINSIIRDAIREKRV